MWGGWGGGRLEDRRTLDEEYRDDGKWVSVTLPVLEIELFKLYWRK